jgi:hypothetical protein
MVLLAVKPRGVVDTSQDGNSVLQLDVAEVYALVGHRPREAVMRTPRALAVACQAFRRHVDVCRYCSREGNQKPVLCPTGRLLWQAWQELERKKKE